MRESKKLLSFLNIVSLLYVGGALWLLLTVCGHCYPEMSNRIEQIMTGWDDGAFQEAFHTLTDGLELGLPVRETVEASVEILVREFA